MRLICPSVNFLRSDPSGYFFDPTVCSYHFRKSVYYFLRLWFPTFSFHYSHSVRLSVLGVFQIKTKKGQKGNEGHVIIRTEKENIRILKMGSFGSPKPQWIFFLPLYIRYKHIVGTEWKIKLFFREAKIFKGEHKSRISHDFKKIYILYGFWPKNTFLLRL